MSETDVTIINEQCAYCESEDNITEYLIHKVNNYVIHYFFCDDTCLGKFFIERERIKDCLKQQDVLK